NTGASQSSNQSASGNPVAGLPTSASFGNTVYPGAATFLTPTGGKSMSPLFRIDPKENVTFVWSYTNLLVRPINITLAAVGPQKVTYTVVTTDGMATSAVWHIKDVPSASPLINGMYQIQLYDQRGPTAAAEPGWLQPYKGLTIAFYQPESYKPMTDSDYCPTCFYNGSRRLQNSFGPLGIAFAVACFTSAMFIYGLLH
ncbi:uncharacterized protein BYT42DRAFT_503174, partial [Radiomyces spectabilis]|uniref:uncharacterized protein n=1 Tax=Radiomyces spectabilis TaxID=64574 RepID=UPI002220D4EE